VTLESQLSTHSEPQMAWAFPEHNSGKLWQSQALNSLQA
jgi:hypothetical protein